MPIAILRFMLNPQGKRDSRVPGGGMVCSCVQPPPVPPVPLGNQAAKKLVYTNRKVPICPPPHPRSTPLGRCPIDARRGGDRVLRPARCRASVGCFVPAD